MKNIEKLTPVRGPIDVRFLHGLIEEKIGVTHSLKEKDDNCLFQTENGDVIDFTSRYAPNKLINTIIGKLLRKENEKSFHNAPWFYKLIKDAMRLSQV